jgi:cell wall-associated NlpC family hydrolase
MSESVVAEALTWLNTPYHHHGRLKGVGTDCAMLLCEVYRVCGLIPFIDPRPYPPDWHLHRGEERYLHWVEDYADPVESPAPGDVALYKFGRAVSHGGIVVDWPLIVHADIREGVVLADGTQGRLDGKLSGFWRVRA